MHFSQNMKSLRVSALAGAMIVLISAAAYVSAETISLSDLPFKMPDIAVPEFAQRSVVIKDFGAVANGQTKNTEAFAKAIKTCADAGGGKVIVPPGIWLTGPIELKSNINLHLEQGAVILFSPNFEDYPLNEKTFEGVASVRCKSPITGYQLENVAITGGGIIDGSGEVWRPVKKEKLTEKQWKKLVASGGAVEPGGKIWWPSTEAMNGEETVKSLQNKKASLAEYAAARQYLRPVMISLVNCKNVLLDGPTFQNSPAWNIHPLMCENLVIRNLTVRNPWWSQNGDGLDLESCRNAVIYRCSFDVGDDAMCMKSGKDEYGRKRGKPTENVAIWDCTVYHGHGGFVIGSEMSGGVRRLSVRNCVFWGTDVGLRFKSTRGRGGTVEDIFIENIRMNNIATDAILFDLFYAAKSSGPEQSLDVPADPITEETPRFQNIFIKNIVCTMAENAISMQGLPEMPVQKVSFENVKISARQGLTLIEGQDITLKNVQIKAANGPVLGLYNARNLILSDVLFIPTDRMKVAGEKSANILFKGMDSAIQDQIDYSKGAKAGAVVWE